MLSPKPSQPPPSVAQVEAQLARSRGILDAQTHIRPGDILEEPVTTPERALEIAMQHAGAPLISPVVHDGLPANCHVCGGLPGCWAVLSLPSEEPRLQGSRLIAISKSTGEVVHDADAGDEG
jgi:hypothetical protein